LKEEKTIPKEGEKITDQKNHAIKLKKKRKEELENVKVCKQERNRGRESPNLGRTCKRRRRPTKARKKWRSRCSGKTTLKKRKSLGYMLKNIQPVRKASRTYLGTKGRTEKKPGSWRGPIEKRGKKATKEHVGAHNGRGPDKKKREVGGTSRE